VLENNSWKKDAIIEDDPQASNWTFASEVTQYSPYGAELENKDALNRYSAAQYSYNKTLPIAVASNSEYREIGFDGFENRDVTVVNDNHFIFGDEYSSLGDLDPNNTKVYISGEEAHTGKNSIAVKAGNFARLNRYLGQNNIQIPSDCPECSPCATPNSVYPNCVYTNEPCVTLASNAGGYQNQVRYDIVFNWNGLTPITNNSPVVFSGIQPSYLDSNSARFFLERQDDYTGRSFSFSLSTESCGTFNFTVSFSNDGQTNSVHIGKACN